MVIKSFKNLINKIRKRLFNKKETTVYKEAITVYGEVTTGTASSQVHDTKVTTDTAPSQVYDTKVYDTRVTAGTVLLPAWVSPKPSEVDDTRNTITIAYLNVLYCC